MFKRTTSYLFLRNRPRYPIDWDQENHIGDHGLIWGFNSDGLTRLNSLLLPFSNYKHLWSQEGHLGAWRSCLGGSPVWRSRGCAFCRLLHFKLERRELNPYSHKKSFLKASKEIRMLFKRDQNVILAGSPYWNLGAEELCYFWHLSTITLGGKQATGGHSYPWNVWLHGLELWFSR